LVDKRKKKSKLKGEEEMPRGWLEGWKEIAVFMNCSINTAKGRWIKYDLPIKPWPHGKYKIMAANPSDLDQALRKILGLPKKG
jgi:hypothetical protein